MRRTDTTVRERRKEDTQQQPYSWGTNGHGATAREQGKSYGNSSFDIQLCAFRQVNSETRVMARSRSPPSRPDDDGDLASFLKTLPFQLSFNKRDQIFLGLLVTLWLLFNLILTDLAATLQFWLLNAALIYTAYQLAPFLYNSLHFIEKDLVEPTGKAVLITGP